MRTVTTMPHTDAPGPADDSTPPASAPPASARGLWAAVVSSLAMAVFFVVMALLSMMAGHGEVSWHVAVGLLAWAMVVAAAALAMARRYWWSRGPVVATGVLHLAAFLQSTPLQPWALLGAAVALVTVVGAVLPSTREALRIPVKPAG